MDYIRPESLLAKAIAELRAARKTWRELRDAGRITPERWAEVRDRAEITDHTMSVWYPVDVYQAAIAEIEEERCS